MDFLHWIVLLLAFASSFSNCLAESSRKELRDKEQVRQGTVMQLGHSIWSNRIDPSRVVQLSWRPRVFLYSDFLSDEECDHLINLTNGGKEFHPRTNGDSGNLDINRQLGSSETELNTEDIIVARIEERLSAWTFLPKENSRSLRVMHYGLEEANTKFDYFGNKSTFGFNEPLVAVVILYLSNVTQGGGIIFPELEVKSELFSDCTKTNGVLKPVKGDAILFFTVHLNASPDKSSSHSRCPVLEGDMWCATKFFHLRSVNKEKISLGSGNSECTDEDDNCPEWAALGECQRNPVFMIGSSDYYGTCRRSCNAC